ncbi:uncharacterized protein BDZ99DRAFT_525795 [Mytilinidion resinicola]|uniref:Uncharacterized protein n=1 Tax=Mytilinidion resinicola TaxID=574789 RepID=A0A6A6Y6Q4_9PEZI|nr:uncharacterized protein BDZ99DRAFT_525795 [Mytilinidion resinicola]KAF2804203.1 hypothetical protein BDZ99DRAFT_525795 [Mytilinidion resinicola]
MARTIPPEMTWLTKRTRQEDDLGRSDTGARRHHHHDRQKFRQTPHGVDILDTFDIARLLGRTTQHPTLMRRRQSIGPRNEACRSFDSFQLPEKVPSHHTTVTTSHTMSMSISLRLQRGIKPLSPISSDFSSALLALVVMLEGVVAQMLEGTTLKISPSGQARSLNARQSRLFLRLMVFLM